MLVWILYCRPYLLVNIFFKVKSDINIRCTFLNVFNLLNTSIAFVSVGNLIISILTFKVTYIQIIKCRDEKQQLWIQ